MVELQNVGFDYNDAETIVDVTLKIEKGEFVALLGANGAGKSTLARLIRGLVRPRSGKILIDGVDMAKTKASALAGKIGLLFQNPDRQICKNTIKEELSFSLEYTIPDKARHQELIDRTISSFGFDPDSQPFSMSRGERQRVALASVLISEPELLILDEPTTGLDYRECIHIMDLVKDLNQKGVTVLMVTHDMEIALDYAKRVLVMNHGRILADGSPKDIFYDDAVMKKANLLPPQIVGLSFALDQKFGKVYTVDEMAEAVCRNRRGASHP